MWNARLEEVQAGIKIASRMTSNLKYADNTTLMAESEEELQSFLMKVKEESETCVCLVIRSCPTLCNSIDCSQSGSSVHGESPGKNTGEGHHALLQGMFPTQGSKPGLRHCRWILYKLS